MAGMGPPPKNPKTRQRQNKTSTAAKLKGGSDPVTAELPKRVSGEVPWHPETVEFWRLVWDSPMASEYDQADVPGMVLLARLMDRFNYGEIQLAAEIRLQRQCYGLTPLDRRRLQWEIERGDSAEARFKRRSETAPKRKKGRDPRKALTGAAARKAMRIVAK